MKLSRRLSPFRLRRKWINKKKAIYLKWLKKQFAYFGEGSYIYHILNLGGAEYISIGNNVHFGEYCVLEAITTDKKPEITIGDNCIIGDFSHLGAINFIHIGNNVITGRSILINDHSHGTPEDRFSDIPPINRKLYSKGGITIGDNVWIGDKVSILCGVTIGKGAIIGVNSVVTKDIPAFSIAAGSPARIIRNGDSDCNIKL